MKHASELQETLKKMVAAKVQEIKRSEEFFMKQIENYD